MEKVIFDTNQPQEVALQSIDGQACESQFNNAAQHRFSCVDGRVFYVSAMVGEILTEQMRALGVQPGEYVTITKAEVDAGRGRKRIRWQVSPVGDAAEPAAPAAPIAGPRRIGPQPEQRAALKPTADGTVAVPVAAPRAIAAPAAAPVWATALLEQTTQVIDVYAKAVEHAGIYKGIVKPDDVRSLMTTVLINMAKGGRA